MRLIDAGEALRMIENSRTDNPFYHGNTTRVWEMAHNCVSICVAACSTIDAVPVAQLREMLSDLERMCRGGDEGEAYTTGYRNGHHNGQIELLRYILQVPDGTSEDERKDGEG